ncbi:uncharacterized protein LOC135394181 isoform X1 [Ornithodoros turicata]|uniref:uncharacterized protein LOC135394181 isoform X1 n=1 Tax=Ornithodoros turicata TaxID=34597 RepID=UPI0031387994
MSTQLTHYLGDNRTQALMSSSTVAVLGFIAITCIASFWVDADLTEDIQKITNRRRNLELVREIVDDLHRQLTSLHKRSCHIDAGLNRGCDYKDILDAVEENKFWKSKDSPGRRKRSSLDSQGPTAVPVARRMHASLQQQKAK